MTQTQFDLQTEEYLGCLHRNLEVIHVGRWSFLEGETFDNLQTQVFCLDCFRTLSEAEVRATWNDRLATPLVGSF